MGKAKQKNKHLPARMRLSHGVYYHVAYKDTETGRKQQWQRLSRDYSKALSRWAVIEGEGHKSGSTVSDAMDRYIIEVIPKKAPSTQRDYKRAAKSLRPVFGDVQLDDVEKFHIAQYRDSRSAPIAANRELAFLSSVYQKAIDWGWAKQNPCRGVSRNKESKRDRHVTDKEIKAVKSMATEQMNLIIDFALITALRQGDILTIKLTDIDDQTLTVRTGKTKKIIRFELTHALSEIIENSKRLKRRIGSMYLFPTRKGQAYTGSGFRANWRRLITKSGVSVRFHDLRARALTDARKIKGRDYAQDLAGHESGDTTERYIRDRGTVRPLK